jgi:HAMP domain-containing protein
MMKEDGHAQTQAIKYGEICRKKTPQSAMQALVDNRQAGQTLKIRLFNNITLRSKFNIALIFIMILSVTGSFLFSSYILQKGAEKRVTNEARFLLNTMEASRSFTSKVVKPVLYKELNGKFIVEAMSSSFGARNIFERLHEKYPDYYFKHASLKPRNIVNMADKFETDIINQKFRSDLNFTEWKGYREVNGNREYVIMKPIIAEERCMRCHSTPEIAPEEIIQRYGSLDGFGIRVGDVMGALTISVPVAAIFDEARHNSIIFNIIVLLCFILLILIINVFFVQIVIKPIRKLSEVVREISIGKTNIRLDDTGNDEIGTLSRGIERMRRSINLAMNRLRSHSLN